MSIGLTAVVQVEDRAAVVAEASDINLVLRGSSFSKGVRGWNRDSLLSFACHPRWPIYLSARFARFYAFPRCTYILCTRFSIGLWIDLLFIKENRSLNDSLNLLLEMSVMFLLVSLIIV